MYELGPIGLFHSSTNWDNDRETAVELERLGFSALWLGSSPPGDLRHSESLIAATEQLVVGTSIVNIWRDGAGVVAESYNRINTGYPDRFILGLGIGHARSVGPAYRRPLQKLGQYLDELDAAAPPVPVDGRAVAALGPKALELARERSRGTLPYLTTPTHTRTAREILGTGKLIAPEQKVVLEEDPLKARAAGREAVGRYFALPNYVNNWRRLGFEEGDLKDGGSDRLIDALVAWGPPERIRARVQEHLDAGADHVALQLLTSNPNRLPLDQLRALADIVSDIAVAR